MLYLFIYFILLLLLSNAFLFKVGLWLYQDQSFWFKNSLEAFTFLNTQFHLFNNLSYYLGYDQGILSANNIFLYSIFVGLVTVFGSSGSQLAVSLVSYIIAFFSFWAFASIFFKERKMQMALALLYTFNPLMYSFRGQGIIYAAAPLFVYSFYKFYVSKKFLGKFLLLTIIATLIWISNVRFLEANIFIIIPYLFFALFTTHEIRWRPRRLLIYFVSNLFIFSPVIYAFFTPFFQRSPSIFNYGTVLSSYVDKGTFYQVFNPFQSFNLILYDNRFYTLLGIGFFIVFLLFLLKYITQRISYFMVFNLALLVLGMAFFELGPLFGKYAYPFLIKIVPFLTNAPFYGLYIVAIPFIFLLGIIGTKQKKVFMSMAVFLIVFALLPLLNFSYFPLQKFSLAQLPPSYQQYFVAPYYGIADATDYIPFACWRADYMNQAKTPTQCINKGIQHAPIAADNPRTFYGEEYLLMKNMYLNPNIFNLRITHNLKTIIVAKDMVEGVDAGPQYSSEDIIKTKQLDHKLQKEKGLSMESNPYFDVFSFINKNAYDFFLYSPQKVIIKNDITSVFDNTLALHPRPVVLTTTESKQLPKNIQQNVRIAYKQAPFDPTQYFVKFSNIGSDKPFLVQFTQAFKPAWMIVWVNKKEYESKKCIDKPISFPLTNNSRCQYSSLLLDTSMLKYFGKDSVAPANHFQGNYVTNTWLIQPNTIPSYAKEGNEVYAVIIYKNQLYYILTLLFSGSVLLLISIYTLMQEGKRLWK